MQIETDAIEHKVLAKARGACGCPTVLEGASSRDLVIVGRLDAAVLNSAAVQRHMGEGEIAVVIPKSLLIEAARALV